MKKKEYIAFLFAHFALFVVFVWFGALKFFDLSPANPLVDALLKQTLPFISFHTFIRILGAWEVLIGVLFIIPKMEKVAMILLIPHMITTIMPLFLLPDIAWQGFLTPTLEGQYMIKNIVIIALAASMFADLKKKHTA
ncbi:MAG: hypothetical protein RLZZ347_32 [Candidatus Parcubacteria bacterium]|jgi:uncharacterized membrane protein YkgB